MNTHTVSAGPELTEQDDCASRVEHILLKLPTTAGATTEHRPAFSFPGTLWRPGGGEHDGSDYSIFSPVVVGGQE